MAKRKVRTMDKADTHEIRARKGHTTRKVHKRFWDKLEKGLGG